MVSLCFRAQQSEDFKRKLDAKIEEVIKTQIRSKILRKIDPTAILQHMTPCVYVGTKVNVKNSFFWCFDKFLLAGFFLKPYKWQVQKIKSFCICIIV